VKKVRCENDKHFYDADIYDGCPHCRKELAGGASISQTGSVQRNASNIKNPRDVVPASDQNKQKTTYCTACGKILAGVKKFCTECGAKLETPVVTPAQVLPPHSVKDSSKHTSSIWEQNHDKPQIDIDQKRYEPQIDINQKHDRPQIDVLDETDPLPPQTEAKPHPKEKNEEKDLHQAIAAVTSHSASEDEKTVAFYDFGNDESVVVGWLVCIRGEYQGKGFELKSGQNFVGRAQNMSIGLARETSVSRHRHAVIIFDPKKKAFHIQQGESSGLTYLNGELVTTSTQLNAYDKIQLGKAEFAFIPFCCDKFSWDDYVD